MELLVQIVAQKVGKFRRIDCDENWMKKKWMDLGNLRPMYLIYLGHQGSVLGSSIFVLHNLSAVQSRRKL